MTDDQPSSLLDELRRNAESEDIYLEPPEAIAPPVNHGYDEFVPDAEPAWTKSSQEVEVDRQLDGFTILDVYTRLNVKGFTPTGTGNRFMVRCPSPSHEDKTPSAWIDLDRGRDGLYCCGRCHNGKANDGGDKFDLAAAHYGYPLPGYRYTHAFREVRDRLAADLGISAVTSTSRALPSTAGGRSKRPTLAAGPPVDSDMFHGLAGEATQALDPHTEADRKANLITLLLSIGNAAGRSPFIRVGNKKHHANIFAVIVGRTSKARKGTSWADVATLMQFADPDWLDNCVAGGLVSGEGLIHHVRDARFDEKHSKDSTGVAVVEKVLVDPGVYDKRLLAKEEEFAAVLRNAARRDSTVSMKLRDAWDTGTFRTMAKNNPDRATDAHVSMLGHITEEELQPSMSPIEAANGFANRILWWFADRSKILPLPESLPMSEAARLGKRLGEVLAFARVTGEVSLADDAKALWVEVYHALSEGLPPPVGKYTDRGEPQVLRLALIYALLDISPEIHPVHLRAALAVWNYAAGSAQLIWGTRTGHSLADTILSKLAIAGGAGMTRTEVQDALSRHVKKADLDRAFAQLDEAGLAWCEREPTRGAPIQRWRYGASPEAT